MAAWPQTIRDRFLFACEKDPHGPPHSFAGLAGQTPIDPRDAVAGKGNFPAAHACH